MRNTILALTLVSLLPAAAVAIPPTEIQDRAEMSQVWVDRHNNNLPADVQDQFKAIKFKKHAFYASSWHKPVVKLKRVKLSKAASFEVPSSVKTKDGSEVPLVALSLSNAGGESFLTADYADEFDKLHSSSDIYIKVGLKFHFLFHGEGYRGAARVLSLGKGLPTFFEVGTYGGGTRSDKVLYRLDTEALKAKNDELYEHPELIDVQKYVKEELKVHNWLEGFTAYKDVNKDGSIEVVNSTAVTYPEDLKTKVKERYKMVDNDFGTFRQTATIYQWNDTKAKFENMGEHYY